MSSLQDTLGTAAVTDGNQVVSFRVNDADRGRGGAGCTILLEGLAGAETADLWILAGGTFVPATDSGGTAIQFTATDAVKVLIGVGSYGFVKSSTAGEVKVFKATG